MAIDDHPTEVLRRHFELEDVYALPFAGAILTALQTVSHPLPFPLDKLVDRLKDGIGADATHRIRVMVEVCGDEIVRQDKRLRGLEAQLDEGQVKQRTEAASELLLDASRRASVTRSLERVKRIGMILANGILPQVVDGDGTEELMRVAMELSDRDVFYLGELVKLEGDSVRTSGRMERYNAHTRWEHGPWGTRPDGELDSIFSKLESYGLVSRLAPPNNQNIMADFQNRYVLLQKGLRFIDSITGTASGQEKAK